MASSSSSSHMLISVSPSRMRSRWASRRALAPWASDWAPSRADRASWSSCSD